MEGEVYTKAHIRFPFPPLITLVHYTLCRVIRLEQFGFQIASSHESITEILRSLQPRESNACMFFGSSDNKTTKKRHKLPFMGVNVDFLPGFTLKNITNLFIVLYKNKYHMRIFTFRHKRNKYATSYFSLIFSSSFCARNIFENIQQSRV